MSAGNAPAPPAPPAPPLTLAPKPPPDGVSADRVYDWLTRHYLHQDQLSWSRLQTIATVEAATIAAAFYLGDERAWQPLAVGTFVVLLLFSLIFRDWQVRNRIKDELKAVHDRFGLSMGGPERTGCVLITKGRYAVVILLLVIVGVNGYVGFRFVHYGPDAFPKHVSPTPPDTIPSAAAAAPSTTTTTATVTTPVATTTTTTTTTTPPMPTEGS